MSQWWQIVTRKKQLDSQQIDQTKLGRVLNVYDLTLLGIGSTLGVGVYVLAGHVAKDTAGPAVIISFLIAAIASVFAGLCYAEFGARIPRAGSAYIYSYVSVGEIVAFIIGWNLILEYMIGSASVARAFTMYLDNLLDNTLNSTFNDIAPIHINHMSPYFDFFSFGITLLLGVAMAFGLEESKWFNNFFTVVNLAVVVFVIAAGSYFADVQNWRLKPDPSREGDKGGFAPFGIEGIFRGAATCFYGFVGFDCIATTGEEVKNPKKAIPISIIASLFIIFLAYFGTSAVVTLMYPYYDLDTNSPFPDAFEKNDFSTGKWIVAIGGMFGLGASLFGSMFPLPRIIYAMAEDSLIFRFLGNVNKRFKTPVVGTLIAAFLTGLMSALFDLRQLVDMMSIGTLLAYTIVAICVLLLRYSLDEEDIADIKYSLIQDSDSSDYEYNDQPPDDGEQSNLLTKKKTAKAVVKQMFNFKTKSPNHLTRKIINTQITLYCVLALLLGLCLKFLMSRLVELEIWALALTSSILFFMLLTLCSISAQPISPTKLTFKVPLVPFLPAVSIAFNIYLMLMLDYFTWIRFGVWMAVGLPIYFTCACLSHKTLTQPEALNELPIQKGTINYAYYEEETTLTIPEVVVQPATPNDDSETKNMTLRKKYSILERPITETELYKNLIMTTVSPMSEHRRVSLVFTRQQNLNSNVIDTDTESETSQEHHIRADVHREHDDDCPFEILKQIDLNHIRTFVNGHAQIPIEIEDRLKMVDRKTIDEYLIQKENQPSQISYQNNLNSHPNDHTSPPNEVTSCPNHLTSHPNDSAPNPKDPNPDLNEDTSLGGNKPNETIQIDSNRLDDSLDETQSDSSLESHEEAINLLNKIIQEAEWTNSVTSQNPSVVSLRSFDMEGSRLGDFEENFEEVVEVKSPRVSNGGLALGHVRDENQSTVVGDQKDNLESGNNTDTFPPNEAGNEVLADVERVYCSNIGKCVEVESETGEVKNILKEVEEGQKLLETEKATKVKEAEEGTKVDEIEKEQVDAIKQDQTVSEVQEGQKVSEVHEGQKGSQDGQKVGEVEENQTVDEVEKGQRENEVENHQKVDEVEKSIKVEVQDKFQEVAKDLDGDSMPSLNILTPPPPPPPLPPTENYFKFIPPVILKPTSPSIPLPIQITPNELQTISLKKPPLPPLVTRQESEIDPDFNETVKTGTKEMKKIKDTLNQFYKDFKMPPLPIYTSQISEIKSPTLEKPVEKIEEPSSKPPSPKIITTTDEYAKTVDFKEKLGSLLLKNSIREKEKPYRKTWNAPQDKTLEPKEVHTLEDKSVEPEEIHKKTWNIPEAIGKTVEDEEDHKKKMVATFKTIKLRKRSEIPKQIEQTEKIDENRGEFKGESKQEKDGESKQEKSGESKQEKVGELKRKGGGSNQKGGESNQAKYGGFRPETNDRSKHSNGGSNQDKDGVQGSQKADKSRQLVEHKRKMIATLRSIKLRKTGILNLDENGQPTNFRDDNT